MQSSRATYEGESVRTGISVRARGYVQLVKPRLTLLVVFSAIFGYMMAPNVHGFDAWTVLALGLGGFLITGASNTLNQVIEAEHDRMMTRTQNRPMARQVLAPLEAIIFALACGVAGITILGVVFGGLVPALLGVIALLLYAFVYTPLKRIHSVAVLIGAVPGAMPPLIGWAAATGTLGPEAMALFLIQFLWQTTRKQASRCCQRMRAGRVSPRPSSSFTPFCWFRWRSCLIRWASLAPSPPS
jgi:heme o synthase